MPAGHGSVTVGAPARPGRASTVRRTIAVPAGTAPPLASEPEGSARLVAACGAGSPGPKTCTPTPTAPAVMATPAAAVAVDLTIAPFAVAAAALPVSSPKATTISGTGTRIAAAGACPQPGAEVAAVAAGRHVAVGGGRSAPALVVGLEQVRAHDLAVARARVTLLDEVEAGAVDEVLRRLRADAELLGERGVGDAVDLAAQQRVALLRGQAREVAEQVADLAAALDDRVGLARLGRAQHAPVLGVVEVHAVGAHPRELVERAVAREPVEPRAQLDLAVVAAQGAARAQHRLLHDVLGVLGAAAEHLARVALERGVMALVDAPEGGVVAGAEGGDQRLVVVGVAMQLKHGRGSGTGSSLPRPRGVLTRAQRRFALRRT